MNNQKQNKNTIFKKETKRNQNKTKQKDQDQCNQTKQTNETKI
jgi:hypothetical protein